jgi:hypothetical protein
MAARSGPDAFTLDVDGEIFAVRRQPDGGTHYDWLSGPNTGYGFGEGAPSAWGSPPGERPEVSPEQALERDRKSIRAFLAMVDSGTGYIEDS